VSRGAEDDSEIEASRAPLLDHLTELRTRLIRIVLAFAAAFIVCFVFSQQILEFLVHPWDTAQGLMAQMKSHGKHGPFDLLIGLTPWAPPVPHQTSNFHLIFTAPLEVFFAKLKLAGLGAIALAFPVIAYQVYRFVAPGLYKRERRAFLPFLMASPVLFVMGAALVYYVMLPFVLYFSLTQQITGTSVPIESMPKISEYLSLVTTLILAFGLCFQLPVILTLLALVGLVRSELLVSGRRFAILGIAIVAAIVTPPDPISMCALILPIVVLYEVSIWCVKLIEFRRRREDEAAEREAAAT
jgi:sec-independent protein translocase protein TatC